MEFFFLTQDVSIELYVFVWLFFILVYLWWKEFYIYLKGVYEIFTSVLKKPSHPHIDSGSIHIPNIPAVSPLSKMEEEANEEIEAIDLTHSEKVDTSQVEKLTNLVSSIRTLIARGMNHEAQTLIVEWLSIEKNNRDLNLLLGSIYEHEWQFEKAEYVYKDLAEIDPEDVEVLEKLANVLIIEKKNVIANEIYKKIHTFTGNTETTLYMLTHIANTLQDQEAILKYAKQYILQWPKNPEIITLLAQSQIALGMRKDAIETYKHLKNLTPYSGEISEILQKLLIEEELANNFGWKE